MKTGWIDFESVELRERTILYEGRADALEIIIAVLSSTGPFTLRAKLCREFDHVNKA